mmetsp:Transcript_11732/g.30601  ORF Transcript_11732/g.30601 Transcript_11732/m.30601 type:complete len:228 (-) Transcript_11732:1129-1812(-)
MSDSGSLAGDSDVAWASAVSPVAITSESTSPGCCEGAAATPTADAIGAASAGCAGTSAAPLFGCMAMSDSALMMGSMNWTPSCISPAAVPRSTSSPAENEDAFASSGARPASVSSSSNGCAQRSFASTHTCSTAAPSSARTCLSWVITACATHLTAPARAGMRPSSTPPGACPAPCAQNSASSSTSPLAPSAVSSPSACRLRSENLSTVSVAEFTTARRAYTASRTC